MKSNNTSEQFEYPNSDHYKQIEISLKESEEKYRLLVEGAGEPIFTIDAVGRFHFMNKIAAKQLGGTPEQFVGKSMWELFPKPHADQQARSIKQVIQTNTPMIHEGPTKIKDQPRWYRTHIQPLTINSGKDHVALVIATDITDAKVAEQALKKSEQMYRNLFESAGDGLLIVDRDGYIVDANQIGCRLHGYTKIELVNSHITRILHGDYHKKFPEAREAILKYGTYFSESVHKRADGSYFPVDINISPIFYKETPTVLVSVRDITQRKNIEEVLRKNEQMYHNLFEFAGDGLFIVDFEGTVLDINQAASKMHGYPKENLLNHSVIDLLHPVYKHKLAEAVEAAKKNQHYSAESTHIRADGTSMALDIKISPTLYKNKPAMLISSRDITERKNAEEAVKKSEQMYRNLFEFAGDGLFIMDLEGNHLDVNQIGCRLHKYTKQEILNLHALDLLHPKYHDKLSEALNAVKNNFPFFTEATHICSDGSLIPLEVNMSPTLYRDKPAVLISVRDITERIETQKIIHESRQRYKFLSDIAFEGLLVHEDKVFVDANKNLLDLFGYTEGQIRNLQLSELIAPESREQVAKMIASKTEAPYETVGIRSDGTPIDIIIHARNMTINGKQCRVASIRDITEQKRMKKEIEEYKEKIMQSQRHAYINYTGAIVAHQLNQPLTVVNMLLGQIKDNLTKGKTDISKTIEQIDKCLFESNNTAQIMSKFRRSVSDPSWETSKTVEPYKIANKMVSALQNRAEQAKIEIRFDNLKTLPYIHFNENALEQIFYIIIQNAIEAADGSNAKMLQITGQHIDDHILVSFKDNCGGIKPEYINRIFEPFFTTKSEKQGMGLGLEIVHRILITSGGNITLNNSPGCGAEFLIRLPINNNYEVKENENNQ